MPPLCQQGSEGKPGLRVARAEDRCRARLCPPGTHLTPSFHPSPVLRVHRRLFLQQLHVRPAQHALLVRPGETPPLRGTCAKVKPPSFSPVR